MFNSQELSLFQSPYFSDYSYINGIIEVHSKNTSHSWQISRRDMPRATMIVVKHKYPGIKSYHMQFHVHTFKKAVKMIIDHDSYIISKLC